MVNDNGIIVAVWSGLYNGYVIIDDITYSLGMVQINYTIGFYRGILSIPQVLCTMFALCHVLSWFGSGRFRPWPSSVCPNHSHTRETIVKNMDKIYNMNNKTKHNKTMCIILWDMACIKCDNASVSSECLHTVFVGGLSLEGFTFLICWDQNKISGKQYFAKEIFIWIHYLERNICILIGNLTFFPLDLADNKSASLPIRTRYQAGDRPLPESI